MNKENKQTFTIDGKQVEISTGKMAWQSAGAIFLTMGGTTLFAAVTVDNKDAQLDYFPLGVEYIEKMYARGVMSGSKYKKREGIPNDEAVIKAREVDHSIRSLFPKSFKRAVSVVLTVLSYDGENDPQALTILGTSLALMQSGVPFAGPCSSVIACVDENDNVVINPPAKNRDAFKAEFIISATDGKILSLEGWGKEVSEETMDAVLDKATAVISDTNKQQKEFISKVEKSLNINADDFDNKPVAEELLNAINEKYHNEVETALYIDGDKVGRNEKISELKHKISEEMNSGEVKYSDLDIHLGVEYIARKVVRQNILENNKRISGRKLEEIRPLEGEIDVIPVVHGSALFSRGLTQSLTIVTLASAGDALIIDEMEGESSKSFMHHYNMAGFASGEAGRYNYHPGRREIGHGTIGENALKNMIASTDDFPYTIRVVSEIMSSNGSTSMAATCAGSLALMAAGVPMKEPVAGIGVGLVTTDGNEDEYKLILDIEGMEDFYGDMDFKVCGTKNGITAIQYENKLQGVKVDVIKKAFRLAQTGRLHVLEAMNKVIDKSRDEVAENAPKVDFMQIEQDQIGELIGPGGKNIKELVLDSGKYGSNPADISVDQDGKISITAMNTEQMAFVKEAIGGMFKRASIGEEYDGIVDKVMNYGAFVDVSNSVSGLVHVSEIQEGFVKDATEILKPGQNVRVKVIKMEAGRTSFTMKGVEQPKPRE